MKRLDAEAGKEHRNRNNMINVLLKRGIKKDEEGH